MSKGIERRKHDRIRVRWPVTVLTNNRIIQAETRNITVSGIFICCKEPLPRNEVLPVRISPPNYRVVQVSGKVIWSDLYAIDGQDISYGVGICFVKISDGDRHFLKDLILAHPE
ncbi:MAG: PilZ domain-containing protein [Desulfatiglandales bacterium]